MAKKKQKKKRKKTEKNEKEESRDKVQEAVPSHSTQAGHHKHTCKNKGCCRAEEKEDDARQMDKTH